MSKVSAHWRKPPGGGLPPTPFRVKNCASKVSTKKLDPKNTIENISNLKVQQLSMNPKKQQLGPVPENYRFFNSPPPPKNDPLIPVSVNMASPPLGFAVNIFKSFPVARVDVAKILVLVVHKCARSHKQTCNSYKKPLIVCGYSDLSIPGSVSC